jgi:hypothetical protein
MPLNDLELYYLINYLLFLDILQDLISKFLHLLNLKIDYSKQYHIIFFHLMACTFQKEMEFKMIYQLYLSNSLII